MRTYIHTYRQTDTQICIQTDTYSHVHSTVQRLNICKSKAVLANNKVNGQTDWQTDSESTAIASRKTTQRKVCQFWRQIRHSRIWFDMGVNVWLDIPLAHPCSNEIEGLSATTQRAAATRRENLKIKKDDKELLPGGFRPTFVPIVFEHFGCWGEKAEHYLKKLSQLSRNDDGKPNASTFKTYWRSVFSVCLQQSNARVIDRKIQKIVSREPNKHK